MPCVMRWMLLCVVAACASNAGPGGPGSGSGDHGDPTDDDHDGIPDQVERQIMEQFGPELRLAPDSIDWTRPANVDWFLPLVHMRFDHADCSDDGILDLGKITFENLATQQHYLKDPLHLCSHQNGASALRESDHAAKEFFLQAVSDDTVHPGIPPERSAEWRAYIQVRPSHYKRADGVAAAYDLQVWNFYAYNDFVASANHEADWEHETISIDDNMEFVSAYLSEHHGGARIDDPAQLQWDGTHVIAYVADGSHAVYTTAGAHPAGYSVDDHTYDGGPVWKTWENFANLGDTGAILEGQTWARYGGRWGEVGNIEDTSGPVGPMFHGGWDTTKEY
jgi:hypothetical protein